MLYFRLLASAAPSRALAVTYLIPLFAVGYGIALLGEHVTAGMGLSTGVILLGTAMAKRTIDAGFTTVRNVGASDYADLALKMAIERGAIPGPRIVPATYAIGATGGHCDSNELPANYVFDRPGIAPEVLQRQAACKPRARPGAAAGEPIIIGPAGLAHQN
jgi:hypothetical protein